MGARQVHVTAEVWLPSDGGTVEAPPRARFDRVGGTYSVHTVPSGTFTFTVR